MLIGFLVAVLATTAASAQTSISDEIGSVSVDLAMKISSYANDFYSGVRTSIEGGLDTFQSFWDSFSVIKINGFDITTAEDNDLVAENMQAIKTSFLDDLAFRKSMADYFLAAQIIVNEELEKYKTKNSSNSFECWTQVKSVMTQVIESFTSSMPEPNLSANSLKPWRDALEADVFSFQIQVMKFIGYPSEGKLDRSEIVSR
jgi:hypothetical protein